MMIEIDAARTDEVIALTRQLQRHGKLDSLSLSDIARLLVVLREPELRATFERLFPRREAPVAP